MKSIVCSSLAVSLVALAANADVFTWKKTTALKSFGDPANWIIGAYGTTGSGRNNDDAESTDPDGTSRNPDSRVPGAGDSIYCGQGGPYRNYYFDLGNADVVVSCTDERDSENGGQNLRGYEHRWSVENGSITFLDGFTNCCCDVTVKNTGTFVVAPTASSVFGESASRWVIQNGGTARIGGSITISQVFSVDVAAGGVFELSPSTLAYGNNAFSASAITNSGTTTFPRGITLRGTGIHSRTYDRDASMLVRQAAGTMTLGGPVVRDGTLGTLSFSVGGGTLSVVSNSTFTGLASVTMDGGAAAEFAVAEGVAFDVSAMSFGAGASVEKTGPGKAVFGAGVPDELSASAGTVAFSLGVDLGSKLSLSPGATLEIAAAGICADEIDGISDANVVVDWQSMALADGMPLFTTENPSLMEAVAAAVAPPAGWSAIVIGSSLVALAESEADAAFSAEGETSLSSDSCWSGGAAPAAGADIVIRGTNTVAVLDASTPLYNSIEIAPGASLKIMGSPAALPPISMKYIGRVVVAEGATVTLPAISAAATRQHIPVVEVESGASVDCGSSYEFKNVDLRLYGNLATSGSVWFGAAAADETTFFAMRMDGAKLNCSINAGYYYFVCPAEGGAICVPSKMVVKGTQFLPETEASRFRINVGYLNPTTEPFDLEVDGCYLDMRGNTEMVYGGASTVTFINGGGLYKPPRFASPGIYSRIHFIDLSRLVFDGESYFTFSHTRYPCWFKPSVDGHEQLVFRNGSYIIIHDHAGTGKAVATFEDAWWEVAQLCKLEAAFPEITDPRQWTTNAFNGFKSVNVPAGKFLGFRGSSKWQWGAEVPREIMISPDVPVTGGGSLLVTNAAPGYSMRAIVANGANTATGEARAYPSEDGCQLVFADGSNWAGTLVADENIAFTNIVSGASPAAVSFGSVRIAGRFPLRFWNDGVAATNDSFSVADAIATVGDGRIEPVLMDGYVPSGGDSFVFATVPESAEKPKIRRSWRIDEGEPSGGFKTLTAVYDPAGALLIIR